MAIAGNLPRYHPAEYAPRHATGGVESCGAQGYAPKPDFGGLRREIRRALEVAARTILSDPA